MKELDEKEEVRRSKRISVNFEAELVSNNTKCLVFIRNISESGIYIQGSCIEHSDYLIPGNIFNLKFMLPSGHFLSLKCQKIWSYKNASSSVIEHIGMEIINPPQKYNYFYQVITETS